MGSLVGTRTPGGSSKDEDRTVALGVVTAPGASAAVATAIVSDLAEQLEAELRRARWVVEVRTDLVVAPPVDDHGLVDTVRSRLLDEGWDLSVLLTHLPLTVRGRPVVAHASPVHGVAVVCVPALGAVNVERRVRNTVVRLVRTLFAEERGQLADDDLGVLRFTSRVLVGNLRLLVGMVRMNRPWRFAARLSRALTGAAAAGALALMSLDTWQLADSFGTPRLVGLAIGSILATCLTLIVGAELWERPVHGSAPQQTLLFNFATTVTVLLGVLWLYAAILLTAVVTAKVVVVRPLLEEVLRHPAGTGDVLRVAWLAASVAMVGGALGAGLESDEAVRAAAYTHLEPEPGD
jgi:hypothetical protein